MKLTALLLFVSALTFSQNVPISGLPAATSLAGTEVAPVVQSGQTRKATVALFRGWSTLGTAGQLQRVNAGATGLEFFTPTYGTVTSVGLTLGTSGTDANVSGSPVTSSGNFTLNLPTASSSNRGLLSISDWSTFNGKQNAITFGTGVQTALGINVGTTGSFITQGGGQYWSASGGTTISTPTVTGNPTFAGTVTINPAAASNAVVLGGVSNGTVFTSTNNSTNARLLNYQSPFAGSSTTGVKNFRIDGGNASTIYNETWSYVPNSILAANSNIRRTFLGKPGNDATGFVMGEFRDFKVYENTATPVITTGFEYANMAGGSSSAGLAVRFKLQGDKVAIGSDFTPDANLAVNGTGLFGGTAITAGSVVLDVQSTSRMIVLPRVTNQAAITTPINGGIAYDGTTTKFIGYENGVMNNFVQVPTASNLTANRLLIASSGNVVTDNANFNVVSNRLLIGTATSYTVSNFQARVQVMGTAQSSASTTNMIFSNDAVATAFTFAKSRAASVGGSGIVQSGDEVGRIQWSVDDGTDYVSAIARISAVVDGTPWTDDTPGRLEFRTTADGANTTTERLRITSTGAWGLTGENYGTSGQVLTSNGSGSAPTWGDVTSVTNSAATNELMKSDGTNAQPSGLFVPSLGTLNIGSPSDASTGRLIQADGSGANVDLLVYSKGSGALLLSGGEIRNTITSSTTSSTQNVLTLRSESSGTPGNGFGGRIEFQTETSVGGNIEIGSTIESVATDVTSTSEDFDLIFKTMSGGATASERLRINNNYAIFNGNDVVAGDNSSKGLILKSPDGHYWRITVSNLGVLSTTDLGTSL